MIRSLGVRLAARVLPCALAATMLLPAPSAVAADGTPAEPVPDGAAVLQWNETAAAVALRTCLAPLDNPLHEVRAYAMVHLAIHDALNSIDHRYRTFAGAVPGASGGASP